MYKTICLLVLALFSGKLPAHFNLCFDNCASFYGGVGAGWCFGLGDRKSHNVGAEFNAEAFGAHARDGYAINAQLGYRINKCFNAEIQYVFLRNNFNWTTRFPVEGNEKFTAKRSSNLVLVNGYINLIPLLCGLCIDSYVVGGVGVTRNHLFDIKERTPFGVANPNVVYARVQSHAVTQFCGHIGLGIKQCFWCRFRANLEFNTYYLGTIRSGNRRDVIRSVTGQLIGPYKFKHNWVGTLSFSVNYTF